MEIFVAIIILGAVTCVVAGIYLIATSRRRIGPGPRCGHCNYNLTGSTGNRCPECGRLFIEAGIITNPVTSLRKRRWIGIVLIMLPLIPVTLGLVASLVNQVRRARVQGDMARMMAARARAAAMQARQQAQVSTQNQPTTAPTSPPRP